MTTLIFAHPACLDHDPGDLHPESPDRLRAVMAALNQPEFRDLPRREAPRAALAALARVHPEPYAERVLASEPAAGLCALDPDTAMSPGSGEAALRAAGAVVAAVDAVVNGEADNAFCAVRPPGHHAEPNAAMGFCLFNNIAVGARHAQAVYGESHGIRRVAIVDFDVHHGNGSQTVAEQDPSLFFASTHQFPFYPGTGAAAERGLGNVVNVPLAMGSGSAEFRRAYTETILPALERFAPDLILISAGFDAHRADPLAQIELDEADFAWITSTLRQLAEKLAGGRLISSLEGGYNLAALGSSAAAHVRALAGTSGAG